MNTTPSQRLGFLHHIRLVPLFACILGGILVLFALSSALAGYFLWQADRDQRDVTAEIEIRTGLANSSDFLRSARINMIQAGAASRIAEMEAMKRNIAQAESEIKQSQQGYRAYQNRSVKTPADEALDTELNQRFQAYITGMQPMLKYAKNGMFEAIINHESEQIRPLDNAYTDILSKAVKIRSTQSQPTGGTGPSAHPPGWDVHDWRVCACPGHDADNIYSATSDRHSSTATCRTTD
ncbi:methyl-accepting chemotaxis protein III (ribose an galactose chemoreceptor protein) [Escherichia coli]|uniref:Methyl-accepting chemotaxis protein III (Ribose an galactose chemoreceptor protein) n=1 Tax=Escherichia coli TaxID=562 RepID=A0A376LQU9_ECOLX|nr:methyl-accepting chemotaxis protein III (ribose an galactose chemoreceptor protein) [Escherichia coli]